MTPVDTKSGTTAATIATAPPLPITVAPDDISYAFASLIHDKRKKLHIIMSHMGLIIETLDPKAAPVLLATTESTLETTQNQLSIFNNILDSAKIAAGQFKLTNKKFKLKELVNCIEQDFKSRLARAGIALCIEGVTDDLNVEIDKVNFYRILSNLIAYVLDHTKHKKVTVKINFVENALQCSVFDGDAVVPAMAADNKSPDRTELRVSVSEKVVQHMGGKLNTMHTAAGIALNFTIACTRLANTVSLDEAGYSPIVTTRKAAPARPTITTPAKKLKVLIVDDDYVNRRILTRMLDQNHFEVVTANNGLEAVAAVATAKSSDTGNFDIILMDAVMPQMDGLDATKQIRKNGCTTPVICLSANALLNDKIITSGMNGLLPKPFKKDDILLAIARSVTITVHDAKKDEKLTGRFSKPHFPAGHTVPPVAPHAVPLAATATELPPSTPAVTAAVVPISLREIPIPAHLAAALDIALHQLHIMRAQLNFMLNDLADTQVAQNKLMAGDNVAISETLPGAVAADIKTPQTAIKLDAAQIRKDIVTAIDACDEQLEYFDKLKPSGAKQLAKFNLRQFADKLIAQFNSQAMAKNTVLQFVCNTDANIELDRSDLNRILTNLIANAFEHPRDGVRAKITLTFELQDGKLKCSVEDNGKGMSTHDQKHSTLEFAISTSEGGTGLGVSGSNRLIKAMGGTELNVKSKLGEGSTFDFTVPCTVLAKDIQLDALTETPPFLNRQINHPLLATNNVLIVDDHVAHLHVLQRMLGKECKITGVSHAQQAVSACRTTQPAFDLIIMQNADPTAIRTIRAFNTEIPIICLSTKAEELTAALREIDGKQCCLSIPFSQEELHAQIHKLIAKPKPVTVTMMRLDDAKRMGATEALVVPISSENSAANATGTAATPPPQTHGNGHQPALFAPVLTAAAITPAVGCCEPNGTCGGFASFFKSIIKSISESSCCSGNASIRPTP